MAEPITSKNLEQVVLKNIEIQREISQYISDFTVRYNQAGIKGQEKLSFKVLKENNLIQIPINDKYWGGAIIVKGNLKIPVINTAQPRVYQYFVAWHEVYHLLYDLNLKQETHNIPIDMELNERMADYFAANMIFGNLYNYYYSLDDTDFIDRIIRCIDSYEAPYKAVLIQLYEDALKHNNQDLKNKILENFDNKPLNLADKFKALELDTSLVEPNFIVSLGNLEKTIDKSISKENDVTYHKDNYRYLAELKKKIQDSIGGLHDEK